MEYRLFVLGLARASIQVNEGLHTFFLFYICLWSAGYFLSLMDWGMNTFTRRNGLGEFLLTIIIWLSAIAASFFCLCLLIVFVETLFCNGWTIRLTKSTIEGMQEFWFEYKAIINSLLCSLTLFVAAYNIRKYIDVETCRALGEIRDKLNNENNMILHSYLLDDDEKKPLLTGFEIDSNNKSISPNTVIYDYLGSIELGAIMLSRRIITLEEFDNQFGYRIRNVCKNETLFKHISSPENNYKYVQYAIDVMKKKGLLK